MKNNMLDKLNSLSKIDIYSLILFALYKIKDIPEYSTLSELVSLLDKDSLFNFLEFYGGMTIRVPTVHELRLVVRALLVYQYVNIDNKPLEFAMNELDLPDYEWVEVYDTYLKIIDVLKDYDFKRN